MHVEMSQKGLLHEATSVGSPHRGVECRRIKQNVTGRSLMPKIKTNRGAAKRFKITGSGKVVRNKAFANHILTKKTTKRKRNLRKPELVDAANLKQVRKLIPYG